MSNDLDTSGDLASSNSIRKSSLKVMLLKWITGLGIIAVLISLVLPATRNVRPAARRLHCASNLKEIGTALSAYCDVYKSLPPAYTIDAEGKRLHSWRTLILPYLERNQLYSKIDLSKAWDDPVNAEAYATSLPVYHCPDAKCEPNYTTYLGIGTPDGCFGSSKGVAFSEITDGLGNTLGVIEADSEHAVHWMAPLDADESTALGIGINFKASHASGMHGLFLDGHVAYLAAKTPDSIRLAVMSISGNERVNLDDSY
jgi:prepilin-type processing-associated H-X9-DG protein